MTRDEQIVSAYKQGKHAAYLAGLHNITTRQIQRIVRKAGASRTISESYNLAIKQGRMTYYKKPEHLKVKRKSLTLATRYTILERDNHTCRGCGATAKDRVRIEIDHIDGDATHNDLSNLQVLCNLCNQGKAYALRTSPVTGF